MCTCARRSEVNIGYLSQLVSTSFFETRSLNKPGVSVSDWTGDQQILGVLLPLLGHPEVTGVPTQVRKLAQQTLY